MVDNLAGLTGRRAPVDGAGAPDGLRDPVSVTMDSFEVLLARWDSARSPASGKLMAVHEWRLGRKSFELVVAVTDRSGKVWLAGPGGKDQPVGPLTESEAARMLQAALDEPTGPSARKRIADLLKSRRLEDSVPGLGGEGLFAHHYLTKVLPEEPTWRKAATRARPWLGLRGHALIEAMGFATLRTAGNALVIAARGERGGGGIGENADAVAVLLNRAEHFEAGSPRFDASPVDYGLALARQEQAGWLILLRGPQIRLYSATPGVGVGSRGLTDTFFELDLALLEEKNAGYLDIAFSSRALTKDGTVSGLLEGSRNYAVGLGDRLRERIYVEAIPELAVAVAQELERLDDNTDQDLAHAYRITLRILFRLLFQAYAEDRGLLPYGTNEKYSQYSLKRHARDLADSPAKVFDPRSRTIWNELLLVWDVIDTGNISMSVPAYNGGLFRSDPDRFPDGALISRMRLDDEVIGHALRRLLVDVDSGGVPGPVDFRSLSIREFGTIYEGLLVSSLSRADQDLALDEKQTYVPAGPSGKVEIRAGEIYFHNKSGMRKSAGVYFTPRFAVDHLLERSLVPVLKDHLKRIGAMLDEGDVAGAYESFFDFRVCDPAMGSGNFLVAAIDYMASEMASFLAARPIQSVTGELKRLETAAREALGDAADLYPLEDRGLLRRQIARHCIYGIDNNDIGVELAKVAVWLHTFVPGLPMSTLDHNLVCADSLTGMESIQEAIEILDPQHKPGKVQLMRWLIEESLEESRRHLRDAANFLEATKSEIDQADEARDRAIKAAAKAKSIFDVAVVARIGEELKDKDIRMKDPDQIVSLAEQPEVSERIAILNPGHIPLLYPQVFLRDNPGFDVMVGNPPWEKIKVEEHGWWALRFPGFRGLSLEQKRLKLRKLSMERPDLVQEFERDVLYAKESRAIILKGPYPNMGTGDPDLYKAFSWRFWHLIRNGGAMGIVLPSGALNNKGSTSWRKGILLGSESIDVTILENARGWVFNDIDSRVICGLFTVFKENNSIAKTLYLRGSYRDYVSYSSGLHRDTISISVDEFLSWTSEAIFLLFPRPEAVDIFSKMSAHPRIKDRHPPPPVPPQWRAHPVAELHATQDKPYLLPLDQSGEYGHIESSTLRTTDGGSQK